MQSLLGIRKRGEAFSECNCEQGASLFPVVISWFGQLLIFSTQPSLGERVLWRRVLCSTGRLRSALPWTLGFPPPASSVALAFVNRYKWVHQWELSTQQIGWGCRAYGVGGMLVSQLESLFLEETHQQHTGSPVLLPVGISPCCNHFLPSFLHCRNLAKWEINQFSEVSTFRYRLS